MNPRGGTWLGGFVRLCRGKGRKAEATVEVETKEKVFAEVLGGCLGGSFLPEKTV